MSPSPEREEGRPLKRRKSDIALANGDTAATDGEMAENIVDVIVDGDVLLGLSSLAGMNQAISLRVSSHVLSMTSPIFNVALARTATGRSVAKPTALPVRDDDGDAMFLLCNILHLRNDKLPSRLPAEALYKLAALAEKYKCAVAVGRATIGWFDRLYHASSQVYVDPCRIIEAAILLDEPTFFARFTERWMLSEPFGNNSLVPAAADARMKRLSTELCNRRTTLLATIRADIDLLIDPCSIAFSKTTEHYIDYAPGMTPDPDDQGRIGSLCRVDEGAATLYLGALRDEKIWPAMVWPASLGGIIETIRLFRVPEYDECDKCDFCEGVKGKFGLLVTLVKKMHAERVWGLCLDCFKAGGVNAGECRYEHAKVKAA